MCGIQIGQPAPQFTCTAVVDGRLKELALSSYQEANHWTVLLFFPKAWSPVCPTEIKAFSQRLDEFLYTRACAVLFASVDSPDCLRAWNTTSTMDGGLGGVHMPLISDCNHRITQAYGVLDEETGCSHRAFFIIDPRGIVRGISSNDTAVARNVNEIIRLVDALIFKDEFGEACPADWKKGDAGIDLKKDNIEGPLTIAPKKSWSEWARPKLNRAFSANSQRSVASLDVRSRANSNDRLAPTSGAFSPSLHSSGHPSPLVSPKNSDYLTARPLSMSSRLELQLEDALIQQKMENMNAALQNSRRSQEIPTVSVGN